MTMTPPTGTQGNTYFRLRCSVSDHLEEDDGLEKEKQTLQLQDQQQVQPPHDQLNESREVVLDMTRFESLI